MSDMNQEDRAIEQALDLLTATGHEPRVPTGDESADPALVREYTEVLGLLPYELTPEAPPAHLRQAILAKTTDALEERASPEQTSKASPVVPFERPTPREVAPRRPFWHFAQAAVLAAGLLGLGYLTATVRQQNQQIAQLSVQLETSTVEKNDVLQVRNEVDTLRNRLNMVTTVARQAYHMRTVSAPARGTSGGRSARKPEGIVYVCGAHQQWYLSLQGLEPPADGGEYHLWFMTEEGKVDGGVLDVRPDSPSEMESQTMPRGTQGFLVTLETPDAPEGLTILLGENPINL